MSKSRARKQQMHTARKQRKSAKHRAMLKRGGSRKSRRQTIPQPVARPLFDITPWLVKFRQDEESEVAA